MYFIISILLCGVLIIISTLFKNVSTSKDIETLFAILHDVFIISSLIITFVMVFYNMDWNRASKRIYNRIKRIKKDIKLKEDKFKEISEYYNKCISDGFPTLEKDLFLKISDNQPKELMALLQNYPELQSSKLYSDMINSITELISHIYREKEYLYNEFEKLENIQTDGWILIKPKKYEDLLTDELCKNNG
jgi:flagellar motor component MotA